MKSFACFVLYKYNAYVVTGKSKVCLLYNIHFRFVFQMSQMIIINAIANDTQLTQIPKIFYQPMENNQNVHVNTMII